MISIPNMSQHLCQQWTNVTGRAGHILVDSMKHPAYLNTMTEIKETLDAIGLLCPLPVLKARKRLKSLQPGHVLQLLADDPAAVIDVPHFCNEAGHEFLGHSDGAGHRIFLIRKGS